MGDGVQARLPAAPLVAVVEVVEVSTGTEVVLGIVGNILKPLGEIVSVAETTENENVVCADSSDSVNHILHSCHVIVDTRAPASIAPASP